MKHYITIANQNRVSIAQYCKAWRTVKSVHPDQVFTSSLNTWWPCTASDILKQYRDAMHDRINIRGRNAN